MRKNIVRLTEQGLRSLVSETVKKCLFEASEKAKIKNRLYRIVEPFTHSIYRDDNWKNISAIIEAIRDAGYDVSVSVNDGGYRNSKGGNTLYAGGSDTTYWKEWNLEINVDGVVVNGVLKANFCGTVEDPYCAYDVTCTFW